MKIAVKIKNGKFTKYSYAEHLKSKTLIVKTEKCEIYSDDRYRPFFIIDIEDQSVIEELSNKKTVVICNDVDDGKEYNPLGHSLEEAVNVEEEPSYGSDWEWDIPSKLEESWEKFQYGDSEEWEEFSSDYSHYEISDFELEDISELSEMREKVTYEEDLSEEEIQQIFEKAGQDYIIRESIANNPKTPTSILKILTEKSLTDDEDLLSVIASNPNCDEEIMDILIESDDWSAKNNLAENRVATLPILKKLITDEDFHDAIAGNPNCDEEIFNILLKSESRWVHASLARNEALPHGLFAELLKINDEDINYYMSENPSTPKEILSKLNKK